MSRRRSTAAALPLCIGLCLGLCLALGACAGPTDEPAGQTRTERTTSPAPVALPRQPRFRGRLAVFVQPGLVVLSDGGCTPTTDQICPATGGTRYVPVKEREAATLVGARARLAEGHTSWTTIVELDAGSRPALVRAARSARSLGGVVLVMTRDETVLVAARDTEVVRGTLRLTGLDKPTAWNLVDLLAAS